MTSLPQAAVLLVTGAYFLPVSWEPFIDRLSVAGFLVRCPRLPTCGGVRPAKATVEDDVAAVRNAAAELVKAGHPIIVLAHSYGGIVASEAIRPELYAKEPSGAGVVYLIYLSAWLLLPGCSVNDMFEKYRWQSKADVGFNEDGTVSIKNVPDCFYNDIEPERAQQLAKKNVTHNTSTFPHKVSYAPWKEISTTYVYCSKDMAIFLDLQKDMVKDAQENGAPALDIVTCDSGHCPFLSMPGEVVGIVEKAWATGQSK
jgi:pimeloyl-ACP methyl ester carboxylesterase